MSIITRQSQETAGNTLFICCYIEIHPLTPGIAHQIWHMLRTTAVDLEYIFSQYLVTISIYIQTINDCCNF